MNHSDVRMLERRRGTRLVEKPLAAGRIVNELGWQDLERDLAPEIHVDGTVDDAHAAAADLFDDFVV